MRNGSDDELGQQHADGGPAMGRPSFGGLPAIGVPDSFDDEPFALGEFVAALRRPVDLGVGIDSAVMDAIRLAPAPLVVVPGAAPAAARRPLHSRSRATGVRSPLADTRPPGVAAESLPRAWQWFTRPRAIRVTPLGALAAAGIAIAAVFGLRRDAARRTGELAAGPADPPTATGEFPAARPTDPAPALASARVHDTRVHDTVVVTRFVIVAPGAKHVAVVGDFNGWDQTATRLVRATAGSDPRETVWSVELPLTPGCYTYSFLIDGHRWVADPTRPRAPGDDFGRPNSAVTVGAGAA